MGGVCRKLVTLTQNEAGLGPECLHFDLVRLHTDPVRSCTEAVRTHADLVRAYTEAVRLHTNSVHPRTVIGSIWWTTPR